MFTFASEMVWLWMETLRLGFFLFLSVFTDLVCLTPILELLLVLWRPRVMLSGRPSIPWTDSWNSLNIQRHSYCNVGSSFYLSALWALHHQLRVEIFLNARLAESVTTWDLLGLVVISVTYQAVGWYSAGDLGFHLMIQWIVLFYKCNYDPINKSLKEYFRSKTWKSSSLTGLLSLFLLAADSRMVWDLLTLDLTFLSVSVTVAGGLSGSDCFTWLLSFITPGVFVESFRRILSIVPGVLSFFLKVLNLNI